MAERKQVAGGIKNRFQVAITEDPEGHKEKLRRCGVQENMIDLMFEDMPDWAIALKQAAFFYEPTDPKIEQMTWHEVDLGECMKLIESNPEYLHTPFARHWIKLLRILHYHPDESKSLFARDSLRRIAEAIVAKKKDHVPGYFVAWHRGNIKNVLRDNRDLISGRKEILVFIKEHFSLDVGENDADPPEKLAELADYITGRLYNLSPGTVAKYVKAGKQGFDPVAWMDRILAISQ